MECSPGKCESPGGFKYNLKIYMAAGFLRPASFLSEATATLCFLADKMAS